jgi:hypothetical protein
VNVDKYRGALAMLRAKYLHLKAQLQSSKCEDPNLTKELLDMCVQDGHRVRETLDMALAVLEASKTRQTCMVFGENPKRA